jgi:hypothetical protein
MVLRPRRTRRVCWVLAGVVVVVFAVLGTVLSGSTGDVTGAVFQRSDKIAMAILGVLVAAGILVFARPRVIADEHSIKIRNIISQYDLPWSIVQAVKFDRGSPWASVDLSDGDNLPIIAVQAADKQYAVDGVRALRRLLAQSKVAPGPPVPEPAVPELGDDDAGLVV